MPKKLVQFLLNALILILPYIFKFIIDCFKAEAKKKAQQKPPH